MSLTHPYSNALLSFLKPDVDFFIFKCQSSEIKCHLYNKQAISEPTEILFLNFRLALYVAFMNMKPYLFNSQLFTLLSHCLACIFLKVKDYIFYILLFPVALK